MAETPVWHSLESICLFHRHRSWGGRDICSKTFFPRVFGESAFIFAQLFVRLFPYGLFVSIAKLVPVFSCRSAKEQQLYRQARCLFSQTLRAWDCTRIEDFECIE
jgi:hypothetical protein